MVNPTEETIKAVLESCGMKAAMSFVGGGVLGAGMGVFFASMDVSMPYSVPGMQVPGQPSFEERSNMTTRETIRSMGRQLGSRAWSYGKSFAFIGFMFAGSECLIESHRAKHDSVNTAGAACFTGGIMGLRAGPTPALFGCATFVAFSFVMDQLLGGAGFDAPSKPENTDTTLTAPSGAAPIAAQ
ncbi:uncharacterized protein MONBRDRAFT_30975 [Monosiga brevicollis MX1]|uniref:Mitochondrial import inner membrane translocase subunit TIM22 n=1 Tax=Monosiga brevicollis TaxID=81824 RepID=A9UQH5_MONBE|nr:uncharacterized protein MONBRDRAFT_30975 [Monosiga brevicollis MX1]EDQ92600.1 predicted protein [Monosiga brevicollis MX1]|eukprot:XP_001742362.1 hypothetical protein [Monosiga brevicollis MX1]